jgi:branched-chain amino acid transport system substrate-binding protein
MMKRCLSVVALCVAVFSTPARADITIAVAGPMTGSNAAFGEQFRRGAERAVADLNAKGGVLGQKLRLVVGDDACDPRQAVSVANDLASKGAVFVAGHYCSSSSIPASDVYAESGIVQMSPASTAVELTDRKLKNVFRVCGRNDAQGLLAAAYVDDHFKGKRIAIVDDKSTFGKGVADQFRKGLNAHGVKEVMDDSIVAGEKDYATLVTKLRQAGADLVYFGGYHPEAGLIVRQMRAQNVKTLLMGADSMVTDEFWSITGPAGEGTLLTFGPDARLNPKNAALVQAFRAARYEPEAYTLYTYASIQAWAQAATKARSTDMTKVSAALRASKFDTVMGEIGFDAKGDVTAPGYVMYVWKNGKYIYAQ